MNHKERFLKAARGEMVDTLPFVPRIDLWYTANARAGCLPARHRDRSAYDISRAEGWALQTATVDFTYQPVPDALLHRAIGAYALKEHVFQFVISDKIELEVDRQREQTTIVYHTPKGQVRTVSVYSEEMKSGGVSIPWIAEHIIKKPGDYEIVASLFENIDIVPYDDVFLNWEREVGQDGLCAAWFAGAASPIHHIQKYFLDATEFFFHYKDHQKEMRFLADCMTPLYEKALRIIADSPAEAVNWGGNFDDMITYAPYFEKEFVPWIGKASAAMEDRNKLVLCHCDGENQGLMALIRDSGMHVAESVCPHPMTKVRINDYYSQWKDRLTLFGGIPSNLLLPESTSAAEFEAYMKTLFKVITPGDRFILGVADTTPRDADFDRLIRIGELAEKYGRLPLEGGADRPLTHTMIQSAADRVVIEPPQEIQFQKVLADVFGGNETDIGDHILELIDQGMNAKQILERGLIAAMEIIGPKFKAGDLFIPEVLLSSRAMNEGLRVLEPYLSAGERKSAGKVLIGTVKGDLHDIGKNMVATLLRGVGFDVVDIGINVTSEAFVQKVIDSKPDILGLSALLTTTMPQMKKIIQGLKTAGIRDQVKIMVGGAPVNQNYAEEIGADGYAQDAGNAVDLAKSLMAGRR